MDPYERDVYWASEEDPEKFTALLSERIAKYYEQNQRRLYAIAQDWQDYHSKYFDEDGHVAEFGPDGEIVGAAINHTRNLIRHLFTLSTQNRPAIRTRATQFGVTAENQVQLSQPVAEHYLREKAEMRWRRQVEHSLVMRAGYIYPSWDPTIGPVIAVSRPDQDPRETEAELAEDLQREAALGIEAEIPDDVRIIRGGDIRLRNPTSLDVVFDAGIRDWEDRQWVAIRCWENRWDVAERAPTEEIREKVLALSYESDVEEWSPLSFSRTSRFWSHEDTDQIPVWHFYHLDSAALPGGRYFEFAGDGVPLSEEFMENPYPVLPIFRVVAGEEIGTPFGHSPNIDLRAAQHLLNQEISAVATNHKATAYQVVAIPYGWEYEEEWHGDGVIVVKQTEMTQSGAPAGISFTANQSEQYQFTELLMRSMELLSGVNSVARGQPEHSYRSGEALKVLESKAVLFASDLVASAYKALEDLMTFIVRTVRDNMGDQEERVISIVGEHNLSKLQSFKRQNLALFDKVEVEITNAMSNTVSGRLAIADKFLELGWAKTPEEYLTVLRTGRLEGMFKADQAQIDKIRLENEQLREGSFDDASFDPYLDYHTLHAREHNAELAAMRPYTEEWYRFKAHLMQHIQALEDPLIARSQMMLGYNVPVPPMPQAPPGGPGSVQGGNPVGGPGPAVGGGSDIGGGPPPGSRISSPESTRPSFAPVG